MELIVYFIGIFLISAGLFFVRQQMFQYLMSMLFIILQIAVNYYVYLNKNTDVSGYFKADALSLIFISVLTLTAIVTLYNSFTYFEKRNERLIKRSVYLSSIIGLFGCMTGVFMSNHIGLLWVLAEGTTLCIAVLIYHEGTKETIEATWKYVFVSTIGLSFSFIGILLFGAASSGFDFSKLTFTHLLNNPVTIENNLLFQISFLLIVIGFSVKMGVFPLHTVCIDAHSVAPSPVSAIISTSLMNVGFVAVFRFFSIFGITPIGEWARHVLMIIGFLSVLVAAIYMLKVKHYKRLIAYSSIEHMGLSAIALATGGVAYFAIILHLVLHTLIKSSLFFQLDQLIRTFRTKIIYGTGEYFRISPFGGVVILLSFILLMGIPPSGMFFTELIIFKAMISGNYLILCIVILILLCFIIWVFGKQILHILFYPLEHNLDPPTETISYKESVPQFILLAIALYIGLNPPAGLINTINSAIELLPK